MGPNSGIYYKNYLVINSTKFSYQVATLNMSSVFWQQGNRVNRLKKEMSIADSSEEKIENDLNQSGNENTFYTHGANYWSVVPATVDGMLGGFGFVSQTDIKGSKLLLKQIFNLKTPPGRKYALDCGAGIGRITKFLLTDLFDKVDMVEQNPLFLEQAKQYLGPKIAQIGTFYSTGLQNFQPESGKYDVIWIQWVLGHLTDDDLVFFLQSCCKGLKQHGIIVVKDNITSSDECEMDSQDYSVTRPMHLFLEIFEKAGLECYRKTKQLHFPRGLYSVYMFVLRSKNNEEMIDNLLTSEDTLLHAGE